jgi:hypothetical protein
MSLIKSSQYLHLQRCMMYFTCLFDDILYITFNYKTFRQYRIYSIDQWNTVSVDTQ